LKQTVKNDFTKSLPDRLEEIIKERILTGKIPLGGKISIQELSKEFHISSTPVRDTLNRLAAQGILDIYSRVGYFIRNYTKTEANDLFYLRTILEIGALKQAIGNITDKEIADLWKIDEKYKKLKSAGNYLYDFTKDYTPHLFIINKCGNIILQESYFNIYNRITVLLHVYPEDPRKLIDHSDVIYALETRDLDHASQVIEHHILQSLAVIDPYIAD
jgi:DNA-binding GntR family transcriptional regulator